MGIFNKIATNTGRLTIVPGYLVICFVLFLLLSLASYHTTDASFNRAVGGDILNIGGKFGAYIADPLLQLYGIANYLVILIIGCWCIFSIKGEKIRFWPIKIFALIASVHLFAALISFLPVSQNWPFLRYGGYIGHQLQILIQSYKIAPHYFFPVSILTLISLVLTAIGTSFDNIKDGYNFVVYILNIIKPVLSILFIPFKLIKKHKPETIEEENEEKSKISEFKEIKEQIKTSIRQKPVRTGKTQKPSFIFPTRAKARFLLPSADFFESAPSKQKRNISNNAELEQNARKLEKVLGDFGINGEVVEVHPGPVVTLYEFEPAAGTKSSRVIGLADDIARSMSAHAARISVVHSKNALGIELPNKNREIVYLRELIESSAYKESNSTLPIILGKDIGGNHIVADLARMPHLLVAGTTGSGKSVAINTMILSLLCKLTPDECKFIMIDPKMLELSVYEGIPHLLTPVVTEPAKAIVALKWVVKEMENRYRLMSNLSVRNIAGYNTRIREGIQSGETLERVVQTGFEPGTGKPILEKVPFEMKELPNIVVIVDEMADLMLVAGKDIETSIQRLAQMARAAGIHIIMATQRPSVDVITGVIKANFPTRISFQVTSKIDSRTILGEQGAEQLLGMGDMLYMAGGSKIMRVHGPFVKDSEVEKIVTYLKSQGEPSYIEDILEDDGSSGDYSENSSEGENEEEELYRQAVEIITRDKKVSTSYIQRCLRIGYNRAANIVERMEKEGIVSKANHAGKREILI